MNVVQIENGHSDPMNLLASRPESNSDEFINYSPFFRVFASTFDIFLRLFRI